jgi:hypothetical protein
MDYYQGIVADYVRAERCRFVSPEFLLDLDNGGPHVKDRSWYIDILAADFKKQTLFLCEVSYSKTLAALIRRLTKWSDNWDVICPALLAHTKAPANWHIQPWVFIPENLFAVYDRGFKTLSSPRFQPCLTALEETAPWKYPALSTITAKAKAAAKAKLAELTPAD